MPIPIPNLDNREFDDLFEEIRALIPRYNKDWTNFNTSDPGIALLELFTWFAEQTQYRVNQVPRENYEAYLSLLGISIGPTEDLSTGVQQAINLINERYRAVTAGDYEELTLERMEELEPGLAGRAIVVNNADLRNIGPTANTLADVAREGNVSVIIVPRCDTPAQEAWCDPGVPLPSPGPALLAEIQTLLEERRLITTRVHAAAPAYRDVELEARVVLKENTDETTVTDAAEKRIVDFLDPLDGGPDGEGWPPGRPIYRSEFFQILEGTPGIDHVQEAILSVDGEPDNDVILRPWELVKLAKNEVTATDE